MSLENNQLLLLDALVYYAELSDKELNEEEEENTERNRYITIADFIDSVKMYEKNYSTVFDKPLGYTDEELGMNKIINLIAEDEKLTRLVMIYPSRANDKTTSSICLVDPKTSEVYVIYVGNYAEEEYRYYDDDYNSTLIKTWVDNVMGAVEADTDEQKRQLDFYEDAIAAAREYLHNQDGDLDITVSGHSAGGNHAQYVTIAYEDSMGENYQAINEIDRCVSFDGQGFSTAFLEKYKDDIAKNAGKITSYCPTVSIVGALMNDIPGIEQIFINIGEPDARLIGYHMLAELIDENGNFKKTGVPSLEYLLLKTFSTSSIEILEQLPGIDEYHAAEIIGEIIAKIMNDGCLDQDDLNSIISDKDSLALLGILVTKALPLV